jgi:ketosteroid isomerase-like protein
MRRLFQLAAICAAVTATGVQAQSGADSASVTAFYRRWFGSAAQGMEMYASFYAREGYLLPPGAPPVTGRDAIAAWMEQARSAATYSTQPQGITVDEMHFLSSTIVAYRSTLRGLRVPKVGGEAIAFETKYFDLLRRTSTGDWEVLYRMWSDNR